MKTKLKKLFVQQKKRYLKKKPFGCEYCLPVYAYLIISILPIYIKEIIIGAFLSVILFQLIIKFIRK